MRERRRAARPTRAIVDERHLLRRLPGTGRGRRRCRSSAPGPLLELGLHLQHHAVLVRLREDGRDQALAERVVERVVDRRRRDAEPARGLAVDLDDRPAGRGPAGRSRRRRAAAAARSRSTSRGTQRRSSSGSASSTRELVLRAADAVLDGEVLHRLHVERDARHLRELRLQAADHLGRRRVALARAASG